MRWPNRQSEQGKGTAPCHASHQNWTSLDQTTACSAALGWKTREQALIDRAKRSQRLHQWESTHLERAPQTNNPHPQQRRDPVRRTFSPAPFHLPLERPEPPEAPEKGALPLRPLFFRPG